MVESPIRNYAALLEDKIAVVSGGGAGIGGGISRLFGSHAATVIVAEIDPAIAPAQAVPRMQTGHQRTSRGRADCRTGIELGKPHPFLRQLVEPRSADLLLPITSQVAVAEIVGEDEDDIGLVMLCRSA